MPIRFHSILMCFGFLVLTSCSWFRTDTDGQAVTPEEALDQAPEAQTNEVPRTTRVPVEKLDLGDEQNKTSDIEIIWAVPEEKVQGYVLHYGFKENELDKQLTLKISDLKKIEDATHRPLYRYLLRGVPKDQDLFLTLSAFLGESTSTPTEVVRVPQS